MTWSITEVAVEQATLTLPQVTLTSLSPPVKSDSPTLIKYDANGKKKVINALTINVIIIISQRSGNRIRLYCILHNVRIGT